MSCMLTIISGGLNQGKTSYLLQHYLKERKGGGFVCRKTFLENVFTGYEIYNLQNGFSMPFICRNAYRPTGWDEICTMGDFSFSGKAFDYAESIVKKLILDKLNPVYIDEIGPLELQEKGFCSLFRLALDKSDEIHVAVRESCVEDVIRYFKISEYRIVDVAQGKNRAKAGHQQHRKSVFHYSRFETPCPPSYF